MTPRAWIERPILSVEDAEALPEGTPAIAEHDFVRERCIGGWTSGNGDPLYFHADMIGWTALVPVEVVEERRRESSVEPGITDPEGMAVRIGPVQRRYVTPWEAA